MTEIMVLQHYPLQQGDIMSDLNIHILNTLNSMHGVRFKRVSIKIAGIGLGGYKTVLKKVIKSNRYWLIAFNIHIAF